MGFWDFIRRPVTATEDASSKPMNVTAGVVGDNEGDFVVQSFNNSNITFQGNLEGFNYEGILRRKQDNIMQLYSLSDYFIDADAIYKGTIKHVYVPFSLFPKWRLTGTDEKTRQKYMEYYNSINLTKKMKSIFLQYYKYANVFIYVMEDGNIITLPVTKCRIANVSLNGEPLVEMDLEDIKNSFSGFGSKDSKYFNDNDLKKQLLGYPKEVGEALVAGKTSVQLNPENVFVMQDVKEDWQRYAVPMIASFLPSLAKKALIAKYEDAVLNLGLRSFIHVRYGDPNPKTDLLPDLNQLRQVRNVFSSAMSGNPLAVTNSWAKAEVIQPETRFLHEWDKYREVNNSLLSAGGISGIVVTGVAEDGSTFASAQVSMQSAAARIEQALTAFSEMMTDINKLVYQRVTGKKNGNPSQFIFMPLDMSGRKAMQEAGARLWNDGVLSSRSLMEAFGYDINEEVDRRKSESENGIDETLLKRNGKTGSEPKGSGGEKSEAGRPAMDDSERTSDPGSAQTGKQPKPSSPDGSLDDADPLNTG